MILKLVTVLALGGQVEAVEPPASGTEAFLQAPPSPSDVPTSATEPSDSVPLERAHELYRGGKMSSAARAYLRLYEAQSSPPEAKEALHGLWCSLQRLGREEAARKVAMEMRDVFAEEAEPLPSTCSKLERPRLTAEQRRELQAAIYEHSEYNEGFQTKFISGNYVVRRRAAPNAQFKGVLPRALFDLDDVEVEATLGEIRRTLSSFSTEENPAYALIHHSQGGKLFSWLIDKDGLVATGSSSGLRVEELRASMGVTARAAVRAPKRKGLRSGAEAPEAPPRAEQPRMSADAGTLLSVAAAAYLPGEVARALSAREGRLLILPVGQSADIPYAALPLADGKPLAARWASVILPSINHLRNAGSGFQFSRLQLKNAVVVGDPDLSTDPRWQWSPLPGARSEANMIAGIFSVPEARVLVGSQANRTAVLSLIGGVRPPSLVYLATHALSDPVNPMDGSFVALAGGHIYGREFGGNRFRAWDEHHPLVVLSACQTALGKSFEGGTYGIGRALVAAGAGQVVASLWNVDDLATKELMTLFARELSSGAVPEEALRRAQLELSKSYPDDPAAWASFTVLGPPAELPPAARTGSQ